MAHQAATDEASAPKGRDEITSAVVDAAADLFAERGPAAASIRDIAVRARVNHGLIHRHFGTKEQLLGAVLDHLAESNLAAVESGSSSAEVEAAIDRHMRVMLRATLDGFQVGELQTNFPVVSQMVELIQARSGQDLEARVAAGHIIALELSWRFFGGYIRSLVGIAELPEAQLRLSIDHVATRIVAEDGVLG